MFGLARLYRSLGDLEKAEDSAAKGVEASQRVGEMFELPERLGFLARLRADRGKLEDADRLYEQAEDVVRSDGKRCQPKLAVAWVLPLFRASAPRRVRRGRPGLCRNATGRRSNIVKSAATSVVQLRPTSPPTARVAATQSEVDDPQPFPPVYGYRPPARGSRCGLQNASRQCEWSGAPNFPQWLNSVVTFVDIADGLRGSQRLTTEV